MQYTAKLKDKFLQGEEVALIIPAFNNLTFAVGDISDLTWYLAKGDGPDQYKLTHKIGKAFLVEKKEELQPILDAIKQLEIHPVPIVESTAK